MWGGSFPSNTTKAIAYITNEEETSIISSSSQHNINQASEPSLSQDEETTEDRNDGFTTVTTSDKVTDSTAMTKDTISQNPETAKNSNDDFATITSSEKYTDPWDKVQLESPGDPTPESTLMPTTWSPYVVRKFVVLFLLLMIT